LSDDNHARPREISIAERVFQPIENAAAILAGALMVLAMVLTTADALLRYTINRPLNFNYFLTEYYLMVGIVCLPMAWAFRTGGYIRISFLLSALPEGLGTWLLRVGLIVSAFYSGWLAWLGGLNWHDAWVTNAVDIGVIDWPWSWSWLPVPVGMGLLTLRLVLTALGPAAELNIAHDSVEDAV